MPSLAQMARARLQALSPARGRTTKPPLAEWLRDEVPTFEAFCAKLKVEEKGGAPIPLALNKCQRDYAARMTPRDVILKARQQGFTTIGLVFDLWHFLRHPGANVRVLCQSQSEHFALKDIARKFRVILDSVEEHCVIPWRSRASYEWVLESGAEMRISAAGASAAAASKKGRAGTITRLHCTEVAFWEFAGETLNAILECVPGQETGSEVLFESTPNGAAPAVPRGERPMKESAGNAWFHWAYQDAREGLSTYKAHFFEWWHTAEYRAPLEGGDDPAPRDPAEENLARLGVDPEQRHWRRQKIAEKGPETFDQEYPKDDVSCFLLSGRTFFDKSITTALLQKLREPIERLEVREGGARGVLRVHHHADYGKSYVVACDPSEGTGGDPAAVHVYERGGRHMATLDGQFRPFELARALVGIAERYGGALVAVERNNHGHAVLQALAREQHYTNLFVDTDGKPGWLNVAPSRSAALDVLEQAHRAGHWVPKDRAILSEAYTFVVVQDGRGEARAEAAKGAHDDHILAAAIGWNVICRSAPRRHLGNFQA